MLAVTPLPANKACGQGWTTIPRSALVGRGGEESGVFLKRDLSKEGFLCSGRLEPLWRGEAAFRGNGEVEDK